MRTFFLGGARSGKSAVATRWAHERSREVCCIVTAAPSDAEMAARIAAHRRERSPHWRVCEAPIALAAAIAAEVGRPEVADGSRGPALVLIDCLTVWTANCLWPQFVTTADTPQTAQAAGPVSAPVAGEIPADIDGWRRERDAFLGALRGCQRDVIVVSNDVGTGIVPDRPAARLFRDEQGWLNQSVAAICDEVYLVTAGLPLRLK